VSGWLAGWLSGGMAGWLGHPVTALAWQHCLGSLQSVLPCVVLQLAPVLSPLSPAARVSFTLPAGAGTEKGMRETFGSTCHGAGRACSRNHSRTKLDYTQVLEALKTKGIAIRWGQEGGRLAGWMAGWMDARICQGAGCACA
jgi:hypothetical protein